MRVVVKALNPDVPRRTISTAGTTLHCFLCTTAGAASMKLLLSLRERSGGIDYTPLVIFDESAEAHGASVVASSVRRGLVGWCTRAVVVVRLLRGRAGGLRRGGFQSAAGFRRVVVTMGVCFVAASPSHDPPPSSVRPPRRATASRATAGAFDWHLADLLPWVALSLGLGAFSAAFTCDRPRSQLPAPSSARASKHVTVTSFRVVKRRWIILIRATRHLSISTPPLRWAQLRMQRLRRRAARAGGWRSTRRAKLAEVEGQRTAGCWLPRDRRYSSRSAQ